MVVELSDDQYIESLKREVTPLGSDMFDTISKTMWTGYLSDAFWEAKLDGFLIGYVCDEDGTVTPESVTMEDLDRRFIALVILYAGIKILSNKILNTQTRFAAKAGPVEFEQETSATMLAEMLR